RLMLRWKGQRTRRQGSPAAMRVLRNPTLIGKLSSMAPALVRFGMKNGASRWMMEKVLGVHRKKELPPVHGETFPKWWQRNRKPSILPAASPQPAAAEGAELPSKVVLFSTCLIDYNNPVAGKSAVWVLEHNGVEVAWQKEQGCCGMPRLDGGELEEAARAAKAAVDLLQPGVARGYAVVVPSRS